MSLLDIEETTNELNELEYMTYSKFTEYLGKHVPRNLWDHSNQYPGTMRDVSYIKIVPSTRIAKDESSSIESMWGSIVSERHMCIYITPTDDDLVNLEYPKYTSCTFPILIDPNESVPKTILKLFEPIKDKLEIIEGWL